MAIYQVWFVHYDGLDYDVVVEIEAANATEALETANKRAFATKWWPQQPILKTWGWRNHACKPKAVRCQQY